MPIQNLLRRGAFFFVVRRRFAAIFLTLTLLFAFGCESKTKAPAPSSADTAPAVFVPPSRIVSLAPSTTETLFVLGLGSRVVGVSDYCRWPKKIESLPKVGGLFNPNIERVVELRPDLVVLLTEHADLIKRFESFQIPTLTVDHGSIDSILASFETLDRRCSGPTSRNGRDLAETLRAAMAEMRRCTGEFPIQKALISIDRQRGTGQISQVTVAGNNRYFNEILSVAGGRSVFAETVSAVPTVSVESLLEKNPDVIFDLSADWNGVSAQNEFEIQEEYLRDWSSLGERVSAVRDGRIYPILTDYATVPGPRFILLIEAFARRLHPEARLAHVAIFDAVGD